MEKGEDEGKIIVNQFAQPEFGVINRWKVYEKIHGSCIRLMFTIDKFEVRGKSDKSQFNPKVLEQLNKIARHIQSEVVNLLEIEDDTTIIIYGEVVGGLIQGKDYQYGKKNIEDVGFYVFDIVRLKENNRYWINDEEREEITKKLGLNHVPYLGIHNTNDIIINVKEGYNSKIDNTIRAEGFVCRPIVPLFDKYYKRIIWKLKTHDFEKGIVYSGG